MNKSVYEILKDIIDSTKVDQDNFMQIALLKSLYHNPDEEEVIRFIEAHIKGTEWRNKK